MANLPIELINRILIYRPTHQVAKIVKRMFKYYEQQKRRYELEISFHEFIIEVYLIKKINSYHLKRFELKQKHDYSIIGPLIAIYNHNNHIRKLRLACNIYPNYGVYNIK